VLGSTANSNIILILRRQPEPTLYPYTDAYSRRTSSDVESNPGFDFHFLERHVRLE